MVAENHQADSTTLEMQDGPPLEKKTNRTKIAVTVILGTLVLGFVILGTVLLTGEPVARVNGATPAAQRRDIRGIELEEILYGQLNPKLFNGTFISGTEILYRNENGDIQKYDVIKKETELILPRSHAILRSAISYELSPDRKYLLLAHTVQKLYRYSFIAHYEIIDLAAKINIPLTSLDGYRLHLLAEWGPVGNALAFVAQNTHDIYYKSSVLSPVKRITKTGVPGVVYNGVPDWVNEEEVFNANKAFWFSQDGSQLAFASFNDTETRVMSIPFYGIPGNLVFQYTRAVNIRYPKAGTSNPVVTLYVTKLEENSVSTPVELPKPKELVDSEPILSAVSWGGSDVLNAVWMNRLQNLSYISLCVPSQQACRNILEMKEPHGWITLVTPPKMVKNGTKMALILPEQQESGGEFRQICVAEMGDNEEFKVRALTKGKFTVTDLLHFDEKTNIIYYLGIEEEHPEIQHLYEISAIEENSVAQCVTCNLKTKLQKRACLFNSATFSSGDYYALSCLGPGVPEITLRDMKHEKVMAWEENKVIFEDVRSRQMPIVERLRVKVPGGFNAAVSLFLPPDVDRSGATKYPLLVNVYGGPDSSQANERFLVDWSTYMTVNRSFIYATIDGRGSGNKGHDMLFTIYRQLGSVEVQDQINVTSHIQNMFPFIDKKRTAIWGWSYGGYATAMSLAQDFQNVFKCGISVAPVSDWALYDTIYTERFMGLPTHNDNYEGYALSQLSDKMENLRNKQYLLVHGTLDDNVHYQQSMMLAKALEQNDILFRQQSYPDEEHGLTSVRPHLYHTLERFLSDCFNEK